MESEGTGLREATMAAVALQEMSALHGSRPRSSSNTQHRAPAPKHMASVVQAQPTQADDGDAGSVVADIRHSYQPNPESYCSSRAKKMRQVGVIYSSSAAKSGAVML